MVAVRREGKTGEPRALPKDPSPPYRTRDGAYCLSRECSYRMGPPGMRESQSMMKEGIHERKKREEGRGAPRHVSRKASVRGRGGPDPLRRGADRQRMGS